VIISGIPLILQIHFLLFYFREFMPAVNPLREMGIVIVFRDMSAKVNFAWLPDLNCCRNSTTTAHRNGPQAAIQHSKFWTSLIVTEHHS
jgi:hypothetical protein